MPIFRKLRTFYHTIWAGWAPDKSWFDSRLTEVILSPPQHPDRSWRAPSICSLGTRDYFSIDKTAGARS